MARNQRYVVGLDIGTTKICCVVGEILPSGEVDVAFVQGGVAPAGISGVWGVASLFYEPIWIFHRLGESCGLVSDLKGKRVAIGPKGKPCLSNTSSVKAGAPLVRFCEKTLPDGTYIFLITATPL